MEWGNRVGKKRKWNVTRQHFFPKKKDVPFHYKITFLTILKFDHQHRSTTIAGETEREIARGNVLAGCSSPGSKTRSSELEI